MAYYIPLIISTFERTKMYDKKEYYESGYYFNT